MLKKRIISVAVLLTVLSALFADEATSESSLFSELHSAYQGKAYPTVIEYAVQFESLYPRSLLLGQVLSQKGESLFRLGQLENAIDSLDRAIVLNEKDDETKSSCWYWRGRAFFAQKKYVEALESFHSTVTVYKAGRYDSALLYAAKSYTALNAFESAVPLYEYVIANGKRYSPVEYESSFSELFSAYLKTARYERLVAVYEQIPSNGDLFLSEVYDNLTLYAGDAFQKIGQYKKAYDCYSMVLTGKRADLASVALQKAYVVASEHQREVGQDPGTILAQTKDALFEYPELVSEFWTRLGIDAYNNGDYKKATAYFDNAEREPQLQYTALIGLYRAAIALLPKNDGACKQSIAVLDAYKAKTKLAPSDPLAIEYDRAYVNCYALQRQWDLVKQTAPHAVEETSSQKNELLSYKYDEQKSIMNAVYWYALACYETNDYEKAVALLDGCSDGSYDTQLLYARALAKIGKSAAAETIYKKFDEQKMLVDADRIDYAKLLLAQGYVTSSYKQAVQVNEPEAWYVTALASFDRKDWLSAEQYFKKYTASSQKRYEAYALFYCGYAQYRLGKSIEAYNTLTIFTSKYAAHELVWNAHMTAANASVQNGKYDSAAKEAEEAIRVSSIAEMTQQAVVLCANVYADSGNYEKAVAVLAPYSKQSNQFGVRARYQTAQIYAKQTKLDESDALYGVVAEQFKSNELADDAAYRRGELYYGAAQYNKAIARFDTYREQFPNGQYVDASYFYEADSLTQLKQRDRAILMYLTLVKALPKSPYCYSAKKNLIALYRDQNEYGEALSLAQSLAVDYGEQAKKDGIALQIDELKQLSSGEDERIVKQRILYENAGGLNSVEGRVAGTKLAGMLWTASSTQQEAIALAQQLYSIQTAKKNEAKESLYAGQNALIIAQSLRMNNKNKDAAIQYLAAAQYARMSNDETLAQRSLYGAVEAFDAAGMNADAKDAADTLTQLYPTSDFTAQAMNIVAGN